MASFGVSRTNRPSISVIVPVDWPFTMTLAPIIGSPFASFTIPVTLICPCCIPCTISVERIIFFSSTEYFTFVPAKIWSSILNILLLFAETDTIRFRSTCLLLKKKSNPDSFFSFSNTVPTVSLRTSRLIMVFCAYDSAA